MAVTVIVEPAGRSSWDEPVRIAVRGLAPGQPVTLRASLRDEKGALFRSHARYQADVRGLLDLARAPALGGSFTGLEPMGLFWALESEKPLVRLMKRDVETPFAVELEVLEGHEPEAGRLLGRAVLERDFLRPGVRRVPVREGRVRATLFLPPGDGPFPGLIDMFGDGGLNESRASHLACRGFATLALPFFGYEDLPPIMKDLNLDYFEEAAKFVQSHPKVKGPNIGVIDSGKGAELAFSMASFLPNIAAVVSINGCISNTTTALTCGRLILPGLPFNLDKISAMDSGVYDIKEALGDPLDPCPFPFSVKHLTEHGKTNFTLLSYPNAGHRIDPPYSPFFSVCLHPVLGVPVLGGGQLKAHAVAQMESWKILAFLHLHLG
uniref:Acyl-CoA thioesterase 6 n=1 Tax=Suricata suricatta TaxID=37032 RepID=A0A673U2S0_SURSU